ncbi:hypothetical protein Catovirus_1_872 [Catovirus CTV1]|uniref:Uncharacterized protein n=1 Tax=Catovirus CTV1 TaxID=1977631 RepID=A0A1V0SAT3_9VIRU|nr:hypothetical protein Catovirus_1_872 [Catovirus CTV1]
MKYKLIKYDENNIVGYIDIEGMFDIYNSKNQKLLKKYDYYLKSIQRDPKVYESYKKIVNKTIKYVNNDSKYNPNIQYGGQFPVFIPFIMSGVSSSLVVGLVITYIFFRLFAAPKCRPVYPISIGKPVPEYKQIILNIIPGTIVDKYFPTIKNVNEKELITTVRDYLDTFSTVLAIIAPDSAIGQAATKVVEFTAGVAVTALEGITAGATVVVNYLVKAFNLLKDAVALLIKIVDAVISLGEILQNDDSKRIMNDLFNIDFKDGPFGVKCWVEYILDKYGNDNVFLKSSCAVFNKLLSTIYDKLISFISKTISFAIPDGGIGGVLFSGFVSVLKCKTYDFALLRLNKAYDKMSYNKQLLFEKPDLMKKTLDDYLSKGKFFVDKFDDLVVKKISDISLYNFLSTNTESLSLILNKVLALVFSIMYVLSNCAKRGFCDTLIDEIKI